MFALELPGPWRRTDTFTFSRERHVEVDGKVAATELDSDTWVDEVKRVRGKKLPLTATGVQGLRDEYTPSIEHAHALAADNLKLERTLSDLLNQAYGPTARR